MKPIDVSTSAAALALAVMLGLSLAGRAAHAEGPVLKSGNPNEFGRWYGRAGGTTGH